MIPSSSSLAVRPLGQCTRSSPGQHPLGVLGLLVLPPQPLALPAQGAQGLLSLEPFLSFPSPCLGGEAAFISTANPPPWGCAARPAVRAVQCRLTKSCFVPCCCLCEEFIFNSDITPWVQVN